MSTGRTRIACWVVDGGIGMCWLPSATMGRRSNELKRKEKELWPKIINLASLSHVAWSIGWTIILGRKDPRLTF